MIIHKKESTNPSSGIWETTAKNQNHTVNCSLIVVGLFKFTYDWNQVTCLDCIAKRFTITKENLEDL